MALPFLKIAALQSVVPVQSFVELLPEIVLGTPLESTAETSDASSSVFTLSWQLVYFVGIGISLLIFGYKMIQFVRLFKYRKQGERVITLPNTNVAFTFLRYVFLGDGLDTLSRKQILTHEYVHVKQKHTWDLLLFEVLRVLLWFNPFIYLFQREISLVHEYLADEYAVGHTSKQQYYEELLNTAFGTKQFSFINTFFNHSIIKKRIVMLQKTKSSKIAQIKYAFILPLILSMLVYVSCSEDNTLQNQGNSADIELAKIKAEIEAIEMISFEDAKPYFERMGAAMSVEEPFDKEASYEILKMVNKKIDVYRKVTGDKSSNSDGDISFSLIDQVPTYPGCSGTNEELKKCISDKIKDFVGNEFDTSIGKANGLTGVNKIFVSFKIDKQGNVVDVKSRAPHPDLETEALRVIQALPQMQPGEENGVPVGVLYSLPITFKIES